MHYIVSQLCTSAEESEATIKENLFLFLKL